jgi:hypothetical protein
VGWVFAAGCSKSVTAKSGTEFLTRPHVTGMYLGLGNVSLCSARWDLERLGCPATNCLPVLSVIGRWPA